MVKSVRNWRLQNECDVLRRFGPLAPSLRPLLDEIHDPSDPPAIVLKYYDSDLLAASNAQRLTRREIRQVARSVLEALAVLHSEGYVHTGTGHSSVPLLLHRRRPRLPLVPLPCIMAFLLVAVCMAR